MKPGEPWGEHERALRRFGAALARDNRYIHDDRAAAALAEPLVRQTLLAFHNKDVSTGGALEQRAQLLAHLIQRYRRHMRLIAANDEDGEWASGASTSRPGDLRAAVHRLPLELREALLLVVVEGFSHARAAATLDITLTLLIQRLATARRILGGAVQSDRGSAESMRWRGAPHLRLIK